MEDSYSAGQHATVERNCSVQEFAPYFVGTAVENAVALESGNYLDEALQIVVGGRTADGNCSLAC